jgi:putative transcriptional regulator
VGVACGSQDADRLAPPCPQRDHSPGRRVAQSESIVFVWSCTRGILAAAAIVLPATLLQAALPTAPDVFGPTSLTGQLLIASPELRQPIFDHAVILLAQHSRAGALGVVINRPLGEKPIAALLAAFGEEAGGVTDSVRVFIGGPVDPAAGFIVHSADYRRPDTVDIDGRVALTAAPGMLRDVGLGKGPSKSLLAFGYAGWAPSQLEDELAHGAWVTVPEDLKLVFDEDRSKVWAEALARRNTIR